MKAGGSEMLSESCWCSTRAIPMKIAALWKAETHLAWSDSFWNIWGLEEDWGERIWLPGLRRNQTAAGRQSFWEMLSMVTQWWRDWFVKDIQNTHNIHYKNNNNRHFTFPFKQKQWSQPVSLCMFGTVQLWHYLAKCSPGPGEWMMVNILSTQMSSVSSFFQCGIQEASMK